jgi:Reverse transcriptase (RNA-dependent DNA polymerase)
VTEPKEEAKLFNDYFASVFTPENTSHVLDIPQRPEVNTVNKLSGVNFTIEAVAKALSKAPGLDNITSRLLREIQMVIHYPLTILFNKSMVERSVPDDWSTANVSPIFKKGDRSSTENYRPISLISLIGKTVESIIRDEMVNYLEAANLISDTQHGFRKGRSCLINMLTILDTITNNIDLGIDVDVVFLDFAKAFDKVPHERLLKKMEAQGITGDLLRWIRNWLTHRRQRVVINGEFSQWNSVASGVPQGSILGPILFLIYINELEQNLTNTVIKFADDTKVYGCVTCKSEAQVLQNDWDLLPPGHTHGRCCLTSKSVKSCILEGQI